MLLRNGLISIRHDTTTSLATLYRTKLVMQKDEYCDPTLGAS